MALVCVKKKLDIQSKMWSHICNLLANALTWLDCQILLTHHLHRELNTDWKVLYVP